MYAGHGPVLTPASRLAALIRQRKVSPLDATQAVLAQIERVTRRSMRNCTVAAEAALADARKATVAVTADEARGWASCTVCPSPSRTSTPTRGIRTRGLEDLRALRADRERTDRRATAGSGSYRGRQDEHPRVRRGREHAHRSSARRGTRGTSRSRVGARGAAARRVATVWAARPGLRPRGLAPDPSGILRSVGLRPSPGSSIWPSRLRGVVRESRARWRGRSRTSR